MADIRCGTCASYEPCRNRKGNVCPSMAGRCTFEVCWPDVPMCYAHFILPRRGAVWPDLGKGCPCWSLRKKGGK